MKAMKNSSSKDTLISTEPKIKNVENQALVLFLCLMMALSAGTQKSNPLLPYHL